MKVIGIILGTIIAIVILVLAFTLLGIFLQFLDWMWRGFK